MTGHVAGHAGVDRPAVEGELGGDEDVHQIAVGEVYVRIIRVRGPEFGHTLEIAQEDRCGELCRVDAFVAELSEETTVTLVDGIGNLAQVAVIIVGGTAIDMVNGHAGFDGSNMGDIDGVRDLYTDMMRPCVSKIQIPLFTTAMGAL